MEEENEAKSENEVNEMLSIPCITNLGKSCQYRVRNTKTIS